MFTIHLEVKRNKEDMVNSDFYCPAPKEFKSYPRTEIGIERAIKKLTTLAKSTEWISDYRFVMYQGKHNHYDKSKEPIAVFCSAGNIVA